MADRVHIDVESFSEANLKKVGMYAYAEHPSTELLVLCFALGSGPVHVWVPVDEWDMPPAIVEAVRKRMEDKATLYLQHQCPPVLKQAVEASARGEMELAAHNAGFERVVLSGHVGQAHGFPHTEAKQWVCTAAKSRFNGLPGALEDVADALGTHPKDMTGKRDMQVVTKPRKPTKKDPTIRWTPYNAPDKFASLYIYCTDDVRAERGVDEVLPDLTPEEREIWLIDQEINDRGVAVDLDMIANVQFLIDAYKEDLEKECVDKTGVKPTQREKIADWIKANGWPHLLDMQAETVRALLERDDVPDAVKDVLGIYSTFGMKAVTKYDTMKKAICSDRRLRGMFIYHGAGTGRWSSMLVQLQNLFRPVIKDSLTAIEAFKSRSLDWVRVLYA